MKAVTDSSIATQALGDVFYHVHPQVVGTIATANASSYHGAVSPTVVVSSAGANFNPDDIFNLLEAFTHNDDVYSKYFEESLVLQAVSGKDGNSILEEPRLFERFKTVHTSVVASPEELLPPGPYFIHRGGIHQAWRFYQDDLDSFIITVIPDQLRNPSSYSVLDAMSPYGIWRQIAVPSRLYATPSKEQPLAGARISLKDNYHLAGIQTTMMSRPYTELYGPEKESADYVKKLISLGGIIVGKTKMCAFACADEPTDQWIDFLCPTNPRGDRYQSPSGSSTGAAASLAGYPWLDYALGTDTGGSIRAPATCNGLFSLRTSFNSTSMEGIQATSRPFDVVGILGRDLDSIHHLASNTLDLKDVPNFPKKLLYPVDFFPHSNKKQQAMVEEFISILEKFLGTKRIDFSFVDRWNKCPPAAAKGKSLKEYLAKSAFWPMCYNYYHEFDDFRTDYENKFGKKPYVGPVVQFRWGVGESVTAEEAAQGAAELSVFREWFNVNVLSADPETLSDAVLIMPYGAGGPKYRDTPNEAPSTSSTFGEKFISPVLELPQLVLPFGQNSYESKVSGRTEYRPIASTLLGAKGSDLMLIRLAKAAFQAASWPTEALTGRFIFKLGDNVRNVADQHPGDTVHKEAGHDWISDMKFTEQAKLVSKDVHLL